MSSEDFESNLLNYSSFIPELIAEDFDRSPLSKKDLALAILGTPITSLRIIQENSELESECFHVVEPVETRKENNEIVETNIEIFAEWVTLEGEDFSRRISIGFLDAVGLIANYKEPYLCEECSGQLEECMNIFDDGTETLDRTRNPEPSEIWWPEWWRDFNGPRLGMDGLNHVAMTNFVFHMSRALSESIARTSLAEMTEDSEILPLKMINYLWSRVAEIIDPSLLQS